MILSGENFKNLIYVALRITSALPRDPESSRLMHEKIKGFFFDHGFGDISRYRPHDSEDFFKEMKVSKLFAIMSSMSYVNYRTPVPIAMSE